jgi:Tol biopolymer transport system component
MSDRTNFEAILTRRLRDHVRTADQPFAPAYIAREAMSQGRVSRFRPSGWQFAPYARLVWLVVLLMLALAIAATAVVLSAPAGHQRLAFIRNGAIYVADLSGDAPIRVGTAGAGQAPSLSPTLRFAPNGRSLAAIVNSKVEVLSLTGTNTAVFDAEPLVGDAAAISWAPDGTHLALVRRDATTAQVSLQVLNVADQTERSLTLPPGLSTYIPAVAWSPDGVWIALNGCRSCLGKAPGLWIVATDGSGYRELASGNDGTVWDPVWSPEGRRIAFSRQPVECVMCHESLWVAGINDSSLIRLTILIGVERGIAWSPDGLLIAVASFEANDPNLRTGPDVQSSLMVVPSNGLGKPRTVVSGSKTATGAVSGEWTDGSVTWTHDGRWLIYRSATAGEYPAAAIREIAATGGLSRIVMRSVDSFDLGAGS